VSVRYGTVLQYAFVKYHLSAVSVDRQKQRPVAYTTICRGMLMSCSGW
jgi:hypothetical protein